MRQAMRYHLFDPAVGRYVLACDAAGAVHHPHRVWAESLTTLAFLEQEVKLFSFFLSFFFQFL